MNKEKLLYEAPTALTFVVKIQGVICQSPNGYFDEQADVDDGNAQVFW